MKWMLIVFFFATWCWGQSVTWQPNSQAWPRHIIDNEGRGADGVRLGMVKGVLALTTGWEESGETKLYLYPGQEQVRDPWPSVVVGQTPSVEDAVFLPLPGEEYPAIISCCEGNECTIYAHECPWAPTPLEYQKWHTHVLGNSREKMQWMFCFPHQLDDQHGIDLICAGKNEHAAIGWFEAPESATEWQDYTWHSLSPVGWVMSILVSDMDGDGDDDIVLSDRRGALSGCRWLENPGRDQLKVAEWNNHMIGARQQEIMFMTLTDVDGDGLQDAIAAVKERSIYYMKRLDESGKRWNSRIITFPENTGTAKAVKVADVDLDGVSDFLVTCEHADPPKAGVFWLKSISNQNAGEFMAMDISGPQGIKFDRMELIDLDRDGDLDILTCEERHENRGLGLIWYENPTHP